MAYRVPFLTRETLRRRAEGFLSKCHASLVLPIPIELIVERELGLDIIPVPGLQSSHDIEAFVVARERIAHVLSQENLSFDANNDGVREHLKKLIAGQFDVSPEVIHRRLDFDKLWDVR